MWEIERDDNGKLIISGRFIGLEDNDKEIEDENRIYVSMDNGRFNDIEDGNRVYASIDNGGFYVIFDKNAEKKLREFLEKEYKNTRV